jgi:hypothetical protein
VFGIFISERAEFFTARTDRATKQDLQGFYHRLITDLLQAC